MKREHQGGNGLFFEALQLKNATKLGMIEKTQLHLPGTLTINRWQLRHSRVSVKNTIKTTHRKSFFADFYILPHL